MNKYSIQYHSRTQVALAERYKQQIFPLPGWVFNFPVDGVKIYLFDSIKQIDDINLHTGLNIITTLEANSLEEAKETSKNFVETTLNLVSFSTLTSCNPAKLVSTINITNKEAHPFRNYIYPFDEEEIIASLSVINEPTFRALFDAYTKNSHQQRTLRALSWLRKGIGEENTIDEFISYWVGLEVIKHILSGNGTEWDRVKDIFSNRLHFQNFNTIKTAGRNGLLHGFRELSNEFVREIGSYPEPIRKTLIFCIGSILGLEDSTILTIANKNPRRVSQNPWSVVEGELRNIPEDFDELVKNYPIIEAEKADKQFLIDKRGELSLTFSVTHHFHGPSSAKWEVKATELWGDKDAGIKHTDFKG